MKTYEDLQLPELPEDWHWEKGEDDGDPQAIRIKSGWQTSVYEAYACKYTDQLVVLSRAVGTDGPQAYSPGGIPFPVFEAVHQALRQWYEVDPVDSAQLSETRQLLRRLCLKPPLIDLPGMPGSAVRRPRWALVGEVLGIGNRAPELCREFGLDPNSTYEEGEDEPRK